MGYSKVVFGNQTLIDLTNDTVDASKLLVGATAHDKAGELVNGACTFDADTSDATANASSILVGETAYVNGVKVVGAMENRGGESGVIESKDDSYTIRSGYHDGSGTVKLSDTEKAKIIANNIKSGVEILGVEGTYSGEGGVGQAKTVTPYTTEQTVLPDAGYDYLTQVKVNAIEYVETPNSAGGITVKIGTVKP